MKEIFNITVPGLAPISVIEVPCLICGARNSHALNTFALNNQRFFTVRCRADGMMWLNPRPTPDFYSYVYSELYHRAGPDDPLLEQLTLDVHADKESSRRIAELRMDEIEQFARAGHFLEVGFGSGHVLIAAQNRGWNVFGLEAAPSCVEDIVAKGIHAACGSFLSYRFEPATFDVIAMYNVIEHIMDPEDHLRRAHSLLKAGGVLALRLPDSPPDGPTVSLLAHVYHFNQATIRTLLERCGFAVLQIGAFGLWKATKYPGELWSMNVLSRKLEV